MSRTIFDQLYSIQEHTRDASYLDFLMEIKENTRVQYRLWRSLDTAFEEIFTNDDNVPPLVDAEDETTPSPIEI